MDRVDVRVNDDGDMQLVTAFENSWLRYKGRPMAPIDPVLAENRPSFPLAGPHF